MIYLIAKELGMRTFEKACTDLAYKKEELEQKRARLFPSNNLKITDEVNTTSIVLSSLCAIKEFRETFFKQIGINTITNKTVKLHAYAEVLPAKQQDRPDGLIFLTTGSAQNVDYSFFFEIKTKGKLQKEQIEKYLQKAKDCKIDYLITISNEFVTTPNMTPVKDLKPRKNLFHFSWKHIATILQNVIDDGIADEDQVFIANELLAYLDNHPDIKHFSQMHETWKDDVKEIAVTPINKFSPKKKFDNILVPVCHSWIQLVKDMSLKLQKQYNKSILIMLDDNNANNLLKRIECYRKSIETEKILKTEIGVKQLSSRFFKPREKYFTISLNFNNREFCNSLNLPAFTGKSNKSQITEIIKLMDKLQIGEEDKICITPIIKGNKSLGCATFKELKERKDFDSKPFELYDQNLFAKNDIKYFELSMKYDIDSNSFYSQTKIIEKIDNIAIAFFKNIINPLCK